jgi:hypothetical protein
MIFMSKYAKGHISLCGLYHTLLASLDRMGGQHEHLNLGSEGKPTKSKKRRPNMQLEVKIRAEMQLTHIKAL